MYVSVSVSVWEWRCGRVEGGKREEGGGGGESRGREGTESGEKSPCHPNSGLQVQCVRRGVRGVQLLVRTVATQRASSGYRFGFLSLWFCCKTSALCDERVVRGRRRSRCENHPSLLGKSLQQVVVWASRRHVASVRAGQGSFVRPLSLVLVQDNKLSCPHENSIGRPGLALAVALKLLCRLWVLGGPRVVSEGQVEVARSPMWLG